MKDADYRPGRHDSERSGVRSLFVGWWPHRCLSGRLVGRASSVCRWFWLMVVRNRFVIALASLIWLLWRSGTQPRRLSYPCQQAAAANLGVLAILLVPGLARRRQARRGVVGSPLVELATGSVSLAAILAVLIGAGVTVYSDYGDIYSPGNPAIYGWVPVDVSTQTPLSSRVFAPSSSEAVVALNRNPAVTYGSQPYGPGTNTAYDLTWRTVADLHLGPADNPLADYLQDMDNNGVIKVHIKPNHVENVADINGDRSPAYSHPAIMRPLVDMLALAGADVITIGDACAIANREYLPTVAEPNGLTQAYVDQLEAGANNLPGVSQTVTVDRVDMNNVNYWNWVDLGADPGETGASSYFGSGYSDNHLAKGNPGTANSTYFSKTDRHGRSIPGGQSNCMGWLAIPGYLVDADLVIDLAKLKVHYYGVTTAILKNWVGATMLKTYITSDFLGWSRVAHEVAYPPTDYHRSFGNDFLWREMVDAHRSVIYWRDGTVYDTPQRRLLYILDAINCAEKSHLPGTPSPVRLNTMLASVDPVSIDSVGARLQRYNFRRIPIINNAHEASIGSTWPIGTGDPGQVRIVGGTLIDASYSRLFDFDLRHNPTRTWPDWTATEIHDLTPPTINSATAQGVGNGTWDVMANISNAHAAFYYYGNDGTGAPLVMRLAKNGNTFTATIVGSAGNGTVVAQDEYFNMATAEIVNMPVIGLDVSEISATAHVGEDADPVVFTVSNLGIGTLDYTVVVVDNPGWVHVDPTRGDATTETDPITVIFDCAGLMPDTYTATIRVSDPQAGNSPQDIPVTLEIQTVRPDFDRDGDVDLHDFGHLQKCLSGPGYDPGPGCQDADVDPDGDVDGDDCTVLVGCLSGEKIYADKTCDD